MALICCPFLNKYTERNAWVNAVEGVDGSTSSEEDRMTVWPANSSVTETSKAVTRLTPSSYTTEFGNIGWAEGVNVLKSAHKLGCARRGAAAERTRNAEMRRETTILFIVRAALMCTSVVADWELLSSHTTNVAYL